MSTASVIAAAALSSAIMVAPGLVQTGFARTETAHHKKHYVVHVKPEHRAYRAYSTPEGSNPAAAAAVTDQSTPAPAFTYTPGREREY